jgi:hypothetical protein
MEYNIAQEQKTIPGEPNPPDLVAKVKTDVITQVVKQKVDVLWVIDNSCSMAEEQATLVNNFESFISYFLDSQLDWHIGVTSTDMTAGDEPGKNGHLNTAGGYKYIDENTPNPIQVFQEMATLGTSGSGMEKGIAATHSALVVHNGCVHNEDFYREDATLSVIVISDEEDYSEEPSLNEFISGFQALKEDPEDVSFSSIVCLDPATLNGTPCAVGSYTQPSVGSKYITVTNSVGGILWDIREYDWAPVLEQMGLQAAGLKREFFLTDVPILETLEVWVVIEPEDSGMGETYYDFKLNEGYTYSRVRNSITFITYIPPQFSKVNIEYIPLGTYNYGDTGPDTGR